MNKRDPLRAGNQTFTYQTRLRLTSTEDLVLQAYGEMYSRVERKLFASLAAGGSSGKLKSSLMREYGLTARQYNAIAIGLRGKIASIKERRTGLIKEGETRVVKAQKTIIKLVKNKADNQIIHQKKRRLATLQARLRSVKQDHKAGKVRLCFGSKKLFKSQFYLEANGYSSLAEWREDWQTVRASQFFVIGSKDESGGCQGCVATQAVDGLLSLRLRLPEAMTSKGKYLTLEGLRFAYGQENIEAALVSKTALSYRFTKDQKGWRVMVSTGVKAPNLSSSRALGAIGVDINGDHLAVSEVDRYGNYLKSQKVAYLTFGKTEDQSKAVISEVSKKVIQWALKSGKPVVIEKLDFSKKKTELEGSDPHRSRQLSSFTYSQTSKSIHSAAFKTGVEVIEVNPAFTSIIGAINYAQKLGISTHQAAALCIARRGLSLSERPIGQSALVPTATGGQFTLLLPARNRGKHVWSLWSATRRRLKAAQRGQARSGKAKANLAPLSPLNKQALGATGFSRLQQPHANRLHNCSVDVMADLV